MVLVLVETIGSWHSHCLFLGKLGTSGFYNGSIFVHVVNQAMKGELCWKLFFAREERNLQVEYL